MFRRAVLLALAALTLTSCSAAESEAPPVTLDTDDSKVLYSLGLAISKQVRQFEFNESELAVIQKGLSDGTLGREPAVDLKEWGPKIDAFLQARMTAAGGIL